MDGNSDFDRAIKNACNILAYADNTESRLRRKLRDKGYSSDAVDAAVDYVLSKGWLDESKQIEPAVRMLINGKLYGKSRVLAELRQKGFRREIIDGCDLDGVDFREVCARLFEKRGGIPDDKTRAYLARAGHSFSDIRAVCAQKDE